MSLTVIEISVEQMKSLMRVSPSKRDMSWAYDVCTQSRYIHVGVWAQQVDRRKTVDLVIPVLRRASETLAALSASTVSSENRHRILVMRSNVSSRTENLQENYLRGRPSDFAPSVLSPEPFLIGEGWPDLLYDSSCMEWHDPPVPDFRVVRFTELGENIQINVVLMTATEVELRQVLHRMTPLSNRRKILKIPDKLETYYVGRFGKFNTATVKCVMGSEGPASASQTARSALERWNPAALILPGIAFGRDRSKHRPADVLIAKQIIPYEKQRVGQDATFRRAPIPLTGLTLFNRFENVLGWRFERPDGSFVSRHYGEMLSGDKLIDDDVYKQELMSQFPEAIGGEMESAGAYSAAERYKVERMVVKGVCDWADGEKDDRFQEMAAAAAVSLVHHVLSSRHALSGLL